MPDPSRNIVRTAPVTTLTTIESVVGAVLTFLATHHVLGDIDVSATTQTVAPFVALALPAVFGAFKWRLVTPAAKVKEMAERDGLVTDADFARIGAILDDKLTDWGLIAADEDDDADAGEDELDAEDDGDEAATPQHLAEHRAPGFTPPRSMAAGH